MNNDQIREAARQMARDEELLNLGRFAVERVLIEWRDRRMSELGRGNGLCIRERDGTDSTIIRFGFETGMRIALEAIANGASLEEIEVGILRDRNEFEKESREN